MVHIPPRRNSHCFPSARRARSRSPGRLESKCAVLSYSLVHLQLSRYSRDRSRRPCDCRHLDFSFVGVCCADLFSDHDSLLVEGIAVDFAESYLEIADVFVTYTFKVLDERSEGIT